MDFFPLVDAAWLRDRLCDTARELEVAENPKALAEASTEIVVFDCRFTLADPEQGRLAYEQGHIPGAYYLSLEGHLSGPVTQPLPAPGGRHPLPEPQQLADLLSRCGVTAQTLVVAYDDARFAFASRLWWMLRYLGHARVAVLNGGWQAWQAAGFERTAEEPGPRSGEFVPRPRPEMLASRAAVQARSAQTPLIDSRSPQRYRGETEPIDPIAGSIPGAVNYFWQGVTDDEGLALSLPEQMARWQAIATSEQPPIVYCGSGVTACVNLLSMAMIGLEGAQLYAGSWSDWCAWLAEQELAEQEPTEPEGSP